MVLFLILFPLLWISVQFKPTLGLFYKFQYAWIWSICFLGGIRIKVNRHFKPVNNEPVVYCCNHFSSFDNLTIALVLNRPFSILTLKEIENIPLLGLLYQKAHILMDRKNPHSKTRALLAASQKLSQRIDIAIAPEGGIKSLTPPKLYDTFEDGAFILAIKKQIPIVPFVFKSNYRILPEFPLKNFHRVPFEASVLPAIKTSGMTLKDLESLKEEVRYRMQTALADCPVMKANLDIKSKWNMISDFR